MGDRYYLAIQCKYCGLMNYEIYYAPTSSFDWFECENCKNHNFINSDLTAKKIEDITYKDVERGFLENTNAEWTEKQIKDFCDFRLKELKKLT